MRFGVRHDVAGAGRAGRSGRCRTTSHGPALVHHVIVAPYVVLVLPHQLLTNRAQCDGADPGPFPLSTFALPDLVNEPRAACVGDREVTGGRTAPALSERDQLGGAERTERRE